MWPLLMRGTTCTWQTMQARCGNREKHWLKSTKHYQTPHFLQNTEVSSFPSDFCMSGDKLFSEFVSVPSIGQGSPHEKQGKTAGTSGHFRQPLLLQAIRRECSLDVLWLCVLKLTSWNNSYSFSSQALLRGRSST